MRRTTVCALLAGALLFALVPSAAQATNGYFAHGYGTASKGMAGAGVALPLSSLSVATNPAASVYLTPRMDVGLAVFNPDRSYTVTGNPSGFPGTFGLAPGTVTSGSNYFPIPHVGMTWAPVRGNYFSVAGYGNGGMNTNYESPTFGATPTGVDLAQLFVAPTVAREVAEGHALGLTAVVAYQRFQAEGLGAFAGYSCEPNDLSDRKHDNSLGAGARLGYLGTVTPWLSFGAAYQTKTYMQKFSRYSGLFEGGGAFDIPSNWTVGLALKPVPEVALAVDVQQVQYGGVDAVGNPLLPNLGSALLGDPGGPGFGWEDMTTVKIGAEWKSSDLWTWRAGYSFGDQPIPESEVLFNILAPGVMERHATFGFTRALGVNGALNVALMRAFESSVKGPNVLEAPGAQTIELNMDQWEFEVGYTLMLGR